MDLEVNGRKYRIRVVPLELNPYTSLYSKLARVPPADIAEAEKKSAELKKIVDLVLSKTVDPAAQDEDKAQLFSAVCTFTQAEITKYIGLFRGPKQPGDSESAPDGVDSESKTNETAGASAA